MSRSSVIEKWIKKSENNFPSVKAMAGIGDLKTYALTTKHVERAKAIEVQAETVFCLLMRFNLLKVF